MASGLVVIYKKKFKHRMKLFLKTSVGDPSSEPALFFLYVDTVQI